MRHRTCIALVIGALVSASSLAETTGPTSSEKPPATCDQGSFVTKVMCTGAHCDDISIWCGDRTPYGGSYAVWTPFVSEEHGGERECPAGYYIAGLACHNQYCDDVSLYCAHVNNVSASDCTWTDSVSSETGEITIGGNAGVAAPWRASSAMKCEEDYCDRMSFRTCTLTPPKPTDQDCATAQPNFKFDSYNWDNQPHGFSCRQRAIPTYNTVAGQNWYVQAFAGAHRNDGNDGYAIRACVADDAGNPIMDIPPPTGCLTQDPQTGKVPDLPTGSGGCRVCAGFTPPHP